jgi:hypothetical protein
LEDSSRDETDSSVIRKMLNRKQKVLTVIALIAFVVIGASHYLDCGFYQREPVTEWKELTYAEAQQQRLLIYFWI